MCLLLTASEDELRQAVTLAERAIAVDPATYKNVYRFFKFARGLVEYRQGHFNRAISVTREKVPRVLAPPRASF